MQPAPPLPPIRSFPLSSKQGTRNLLFTCIPFAIIFAFSCLNISYSVRHHRSYWLSLIFAIFAMIILLLSLLSYLNRKDARIEIRGERIILMTGGNTIRLSGSMGEVAFLKITLNERYNEVSYYSIIFKSGRRISFDYFASGRDELIAILESQTGLRFTV